MVVLSSLSSFLLQPFYAITLILGVGIIYLAQWWHKHRLMPPGLSYFPVFGKSISPFTMQISLKEMQQKYGDIFTIKIGARKIVVLNTMETIKEVFGKHGHNFTNLPTGFSMFYLATYDKGNSLAVSEGESWKTQRRFMMASLKDLGFGKPNMEESIQAEAENAVHFLRELEGKPLDMIKSGLLGRMTANIISSLVFGKRFDFEDETLKNMVRDADNFMTTVVEAMSTPTEKFPILRYFPDCISGMGPLRRCREDYYAFMEKMVSEHMKDYDPTNVQNMIDVYLKANQERQCDGKETPPFTRLHMLSNLLLLFQGGTDDVVSMFSWVLLLAAKNPEAQKKVQEELDRVVGRQRLPSWKDKNLLPYVEAFYLEAQRVGAPIPISVMHSSIEDVTVMGYKLPAGTDVMCNLWSVYRDPKLWDDPGKFLPERFIGEDGKINKMRDYIMTFSVGKRTCPGQSLANLEIFILFTTIIQTFTLILPDGVDSNKDELEDSAIRRLGTCNLCAVLRDY